MAEKKDSADVKKEFAREQIRFLYDNGIDDETRVSRIFRVAGPGQIREAYKLASCRDWSLTENQIDKDTLECLLSGFGCVDWTDECRRFKRVLVELGFYAPETDNPAVFDRVIEGALEILIPGSYEFTKEELEEIERRLKKRKGNGKFTE